MLPLPRCLQPSTPDSPCGGAIHRCCEWSSPSRLRWCLKIREVKIKKQSEIVRSQWRVGNYFYFLSSHDSQNIYPLFVCSSLSREGRYRPGKGILQCLYLTEPLLFSVTTEWRAGSALVPPQTCSQTVTNGGKGGRGQERIQTCATTVP